MKQNCLTCKHWKVVKCELLGWLERFGKNEETYCCIDYEMEMEINGK